MFQPRRRQLLKTGLAGSLLLGVAGWLAPPLPAAPTRAPASSPFPSFSPEVREMLAAVAGCLLAGALPGEPDARRQALAAEVDALAQTVAGLSLATQKEIGELFGLLTVAPGRRLLAGVARPWGEASAAEVGEFLESWRGSRFGLLQSAYHALHDLVFGAWYAQPGHWAAIGYPGPPELFK